MLGGMKPAFRTLVLAGAVLAGSLSGGPAAAAPEDALDYLVGTWNCAHTVGDFSGTYVTKFAKVLGDRWLEQTYDFPAMASEPAIRADYFLGYDPRRAGWVRFGAHSNGMYFGMRSTGPSDATIAWQYVLPGANASATWTKRSDREFAIDGPSYPQNGRTVTEHHVCKKT
jgi:hypothetical protein